MNTSVPRSVKGVGSEARERAPEPGGRSGPSLGDLIDEAVADRPVPAPGSGDHRADMEAIAAEMARFAAPAGGRKVPAGRRRNGAEPAQTQSDDLRAPGDGAARYLSEDAIRNAIQEIARRQAVLDQPVATHGAPSYAAEPAPRSLDASDQPSKDDRPAAIGIGSQPTAAASPADSAIGEVSHHDAAPPAGPKAQAAAGGRRMGSDLGAEVAETFDRFSRDLHAAIQATDARPAVQNLDRQVRQIGRAVDGIGAGLPSNETLSRIGEQTREVRDLLSSAAGRSPPFDAVERQVTAIETRLGRLAAMPDGAPAAERTLAEVRSLLDSFQPGAAIASLESRLDDLSDRIARGLDDKDAAGLIQGLSRRVDEIHASLRSQMAESAADTRPLEGLIRGIADRIGQAREASSDFTQLEAAMRDFATRMESAGPGADQRGVQAIEAQISRLAERLDRSESSLRSFDGVEQSLHELFSQFEVTRQVAIDAAENAARTAARDTLRAALQNPTIALRPAEASAGLADQMARGIDDLRAMQEVSDRRTQAVLADVRGLIERLAQHLDGPNRPGTAKADPIADRRSPGGDASRRRDRNRGSDASRPAETPSAVEEPHAGGVPPQSVKDPIDLLIEPGLGRVQQGRTEPRFDAERETGLEAGLPPADLPPADLPGAGLPGASLPGAGLPHATLPGSAAANDGDGPASFIAAARRAAQAAQASAASTAALKAADRRTAPGGSETLEARAPGRAKAYLARRRRPILLGIAALVLLVGALEVIKLSFDGSGSTRIGTAGAGSLAASGTRLAAADPEARQPAPVTTPIPTAPIPAAPVASAPVASAPVAETPAASPARPPLPSFLAGSIKPQPAAGDGIGDGLRSLATAGDAAAQYEVGLRFADGRGVARDPKQALAWFQKAAQQGLAPAEYRLGSMYEKGIGADRDPAQAMAWYGKAADAGHIRAMHNLAVMSAEGAVGKPDYAKAAQWFQKASAYGVRDSQFNLAILYARGLGIEQSLAQSYTWFAVAASEGDDDAAKKRDEVAQKLDGKTLASAKAAAEAYRPTPQTPAANEVAPPPGGWNSVAPQTSGEAPSNGAAAARVSRL